MLLDDLHIYVCIKALQVVEYLPIMPGCQLSSCHTDPIPRRTLVSATCTPQETELKTEVLVHLVHLVYLLHAAARITVEVAAIRMTVYSPPGVVARTPRSIQRIRVPSRLPESHLPNHCLPESHLLEYRLLVSPQVSVIRLGRYMMLVIRSGVA